ncbi:MAG: hypothetical protein U0Q16_14885 [Bryobacteraceae bacterium]
MKPASGELRLIALLRRGGELVARVTAGAFVEGEGLRIEPKVMPLAAAPEQLVPGKRELLRAWQSLGTVRTANAEVRRDVMFVLERTVADPACAATAERLPEDWAREPAPPRATAAHPRAYRGTKTQPPKPKQTATIDLRPHLNHARSLRVILGGDFPPEPKGLPAQFVEWLWWRVRGLKPSERKAWLRTFEALDLDRNEALRAAACHVLAIAPETALAWCAAMVALPEPRRIVFLTRLLETEAWNTRGSEAHVRELSGLAPDDRFADWAGEYFATLRDGHSVEYLLAGARLASTFSRSWLGATGSCGDVPEAEIAEIGLLTESWLAASLWEACGEFAGMSDAIRRSRWREMDPGCIREYFDALVSIRRHDLTSAAKRRKWEAVRSFLPEIEETILAAPRSHQAKAANLFRLWLWDWDDSRTVAQRMPLALRLIRRIATPPFSQRGVAAGALLELSPALTERMLSGSQSSFEALDRACRRHNDGSLIYAGLATLARELGEFTVLAFEQQSKKLMATARVLGGVSEAAQRTIVRECKQHPLFRTEAQDLVPELDKLPRTLTNPIPARFHAWMRGEIELTESRIARYRRVMAERLTLTRLDLIRHAVIDWLKRGLPLTEPRDSDVHALRMLGGIDSNRRTLRRFLKAYWSGEHDWLAKHPATLRWYRRHPAIPREVWETGIDFRGEFIIHVERDPLEALKLGTYVGTCLGIGGQCTYSAAAAAIDANQRVLYARDHRGRVVARQLVAISDDDRLVCFSVYPESASKAVRAAFAAYDRAFARALGIPVFVDTGDGARYSIASVLALDWWDDGAWDFDELGSEV